MAPLGNQISNEQIFMNDLDIAFHTFTQCLKDKSLES